MVKPIKSKTALILGGSSSLTKAVLSLLQSEGVSTSVTYRDQFKENVLKNEHYFLDISKVQKVENFLDDIKGRNFDFVINLIGSTSNYYSSYEYKSIDEYFRTYVSNLIFLFDNLFMDSRLAKYGRILHISSRAAKYGSFDRFYAASKSAIEAYIKSIPRSIDSSISINAINVGLIVNSKMFLDMDVSTRELHQNKAENNLLDCMEVAQYVVKILTDIQTYSGRVIYIGPQYD